MIIYTHHKEVRDLARDIGVKCLNMLMASQALETDFDTLKKSFADDGIEELDHCIGGILDALAQSQNDMVALADILTTYADELEATK